MKYRHAIIVPMNIVEQCNLAAYQLGIDPEGKLNTISIPLVPEDGEDDAEPTHYGAAGCMSEAQRLYLEANQASFPGARWWRWEDSMGEDYRLLVASWNNENIGEWWSWKKSLTICGLKLKITPITP